jgi:hypothetical protein
MPLMLPRVYIVLGLALLAGCSSPPGKSIEGVFVCFCAKDLITSCLLDQSQVIVVQ